MPHSQLYQLYERVLFPDKFSEIGWKFSVDCLISCTPLTFFLSDPFSLLLGYQLVFFPSKSTVSIRNLKEPEWELPKYFL